MKEGMFDFNENECAECENTDEEKDYPIGAEKYKDKISMVQKIFENNKSDETEKTIAGGTGFTEEELNKTEHQGFQDLNKTEMWDEIAGNHIENNGAEIIADPIDKMISNIKQKERGREMASPKMRELSDYSPIIDGGEKFEDIKTESPDKERKDNVANDNNVSEIE